MNDGAYAANVVHEMSDACQKESTTQTWLLATNCVRVRALHEHVCALNSQVLDREWDSPQFCEQKSPKQIAHTGKTSVFEPLCCVLCVVCCCLLCVVVCCLLCVVGCVLLVVGCVLLVE